MYFREGTNCPYTTIEQLIYLLFHFLESNCRRLKFQVHSRTDFQIPESQSGTLKSHQLFKQHANTSSLKLFLIAYCNFVTLESSMFTKDKNQVVRHIFNGVVSIGSLESDS